MWSRKELKIKSKMRYRANYWKSVLAALILVFIVGGTGSTLTGIWETGHNVGNSSKEQDSGEKITYDDIVEEIGEENTVMVISIFLLVLAVVIVVVLVIAIPLQILVFNPLEIGCKRFFMKNLKEDASAREICYAFDNNYKNNVKTMFFRNLYTFLWCLLLIIPGIIKSYEYKMIPYLLAENPNMNKEEAFALSKKMMYGNKWKSFVLDISFLGWEILNVLTLGILGIFYLSPYEAQTEAALYNAVKNQ